MPFALLWSILFPLLKAALQALLPWLIDKITADIKAGRVPKIDDSELRMQLIARKEVVRRMYRDAQ